MSESVGRTEGAFDAFELKANEVSTLKKVAWDKEWWRDSSLWHDGDTNRPRQKCSREKKVRNDEEERMMTKRGGEES